MGDPHGQSQYRQNKNTQNKGGDKEEIQEIVA
jgi:hypothetical protein